MEGPGVSYGRLSDKCYGTRRHKGAEPQEVAGRARCAETRWLGRGEKQTRLLGEGAPGGGNSPCKGPAAGADWFEDH